MLHLQMKQSKIFIIFIRLWIRVFEKNIESEIDEYYDLRFKRSLKSLVEKKPSFDFVVSLLYVKEFFLCVKNKLARYHFFRLRLERFIDSNRYIEKKDLSHRKNDKSYLFGNFIHFIKNIFSDTSIIPFIKRCKCIFRSNFDYKYQYGQ